MDESYLFISYIIYYNFRIIILYKCCYKNAFVKNARAIQCNDLNCRARQSRSKEKKAHWGKESRSLLRGFLVRISRIFNSF